MFCCMRCQEDLTLIVLMSRCCRRPSRILFLRQDDHCIAPLCALRIKEFKDSYIKLSTPRVRAYIDITSIKGCFIIVQMRLIRRVLCFLMTKTSSIESFMMRMTPLLMVIFVVRRPMAWYVKVIGVPNCISG